MKIKFPITKNTLTIAFHPPYDTSTEKGRSNERKRRIALTALTSMICKVLSMAIPLITLKITYNYLSPEVYGLWSAVTTFFALFAFSDLGLGNGLQTKLSQANGKDDIELARKIISNTYSILWFVALLLFVIFLSIYPFVDWVNLLNAQSNETIVLAASVVFVIVIPRILAIPIAIIQRTQNALQEGYRYNTWSIVGYVLNVIGIIIIAKLDLGKLTLLAYSSFLSVIVAALNMFVYFRFQRKELRFSFKLFEFKFAKDLLKLGILFSILSILITVGLAMDTFIVARTIDLKEAASYSIIYRLAAIFSAVIAIFSMPLWGANGEAIARGDVKWVQKNTKKMSITLGTIAIIIGVLGVSLSKFVFRIWLGEDFEFSFWALFWLAIMKVILSFISPYFMVLNALGIVKKQILLFSIYTPLVFVLKYYLSQKYGVAMIPMIGAVLYLIIISVGTYYISNKELAKLSQRVDI